MRNSKETFDQWAARIKRELAGLSAKTQKLQKTLEKKAKDNPDLYRPMSGDERAENKGYIDRHGLQEGLAGTSGISDVDVDWDDEDLEKAEKRQSDRNYYRQSRIYDISEKDRAKVFLQLLSTIQTMAWYGKGNSVIKDCTEDIKSGKYDWREIPTNVRTAIYDYVTSIHRFVNNQDNTADIKRTREEN